MENNFKFYDFNSSEELVYELSNRIILDLKRSIEINDKAYLALSGGSTPKKLFQNLSIQDLAWDKVVVTLVDERWVDNENVNSNDYLIRNYFLKNKAKYAKYVPLKNIVVKAKDGLTITRNRLKVIPEFDVVVLGMGLDAHTASFFPNAYNLDELFNTEELCCVTEANVEPKERVTLSRSFLLTSKSLILHIEGSDKKEVFDIASNSSDVKSVPILSMMQQEKPILEVYFA